jgi:hydrogenase maturation protease
LLVIGYGNTLRSDDGVGPKVAAAVEQENLPGVRTLACHQLTPELAEPVSRADRVVFVDAAGDGSTGWQMRELSPAEGGQVMAHATDPRMLLAIAREVFDRCPKAWLLTIPVANFELGEDLSATAQRGLDQALTEIRALAADRDGANREKADRGNTEGRKRRKKDTASPDSPVQTE